MYLEGEFKDICLEDTPLLVEITIAMYMTDDIAEHFEQISNCNFVKFLGGVPNLEKLVGLIYFTKVTFCSHLFNMLVHPQRKGALMLCMAFGKVFVEMKMVYLGGLVPC